MKRDHAEKVLCNTNTQFSWLNMIQFSVSNCDKSSWQSRLILHLNCYCRHVLPGFSQYYMNFDVLLVSWQEIFGITQWGSYFQWRSEEGHQQLIYSAKLTASGGSVITQESIFLNLKKKQCSWQQNSIFLSNQILNCFEDS